MIDANRRIRYKEIIDTEYTDASKDILESMLVNGTGLVEHVWLHANRLASHRSHNRESPITVYITKKQKEP